ncbi:hypothetical protein P7228_11810 [Altererythrobacter arenosus]|uniref:Uncharacterized protein n=1 Tax=Altererythrobacter arenosus TaxID=3032592 RepID=A0ABY8FNT2_9SPHN|nr:hypothetical protein [Altererythrobacter sp. CAU 1644]WFL76679.1 hypothetical protein P7228_11810 [Altererythrobacter sp. CAU 1644]
MSTKNKLFAKGGIATAAVGAMALAGATPAQARHDNDGIDAGDVIAGAVILGGIAAVASAVGKNRDRYGDYRYDDRYRDRYRDRDYRYGDRYNRRYGNARSAVERCVRAVERDARRAGYRFADVTEIRDVDRKRYGFRVSGRLVVDGNRGYGRYNSRYNRYDRYDRDGRYDRRYSSDSGKFRCDISRGRVVDIDYKGIRGLH